jgi:hypothetical protein
LYAKNPKNFTQKTVETNKLSGYRMQINTERPVVSLYKNSELSEEKSRE